MSVKDSFRGSTGFLVRVNKAASIVGIMFADMVCGIVFDSLKGNHYPIVLQTSKTRP